MSKSIKLNVVFKTLLSICNILFPLITAPYVARVLSVDGFTEYNRAVSIISWFSPFAVFGVYTYGMRTISQIKKDIQKVHELFTKLFIISIITSTIVTVIYLLFINIFSSFREYKTVYTIFSLQLFCLFFAIDWLNEAFENYGFILVKSFICRLLYVVAIFIFIKSTNDVLLYTSISSFTILLNNVLTFIYIKRKVIFVHCGLYDIFNLLKSLFVVFLLVNSSMLYTILDRFFLVWFGNKLELTYYSISQVIPHSIITVISSVILVTIPRLSYYWSNKKKESYFELLNTSINMFLLINIPCCIGMACLSYEIIYIYSGEKYILASPVLLLFSIRYLISAFDMILSKQILLATGNENVLTKIYYTGGIFNLILKIVLVLFNILTPALCIVTTACSDLLIIILQCIEVKKLDINVKIMNNSVIYYIIISFIFIPVILIIKSLISETGIQAITIVSLLSTVICSVIYILLLWIKKDKYFLYLVRSICKK
jgi:O-antigen/teichoic acid export membrane protein